MSENDLRLNPNANILAGACGGLLSFLVGHPLDTVKVQLQTMQACPKSGTYPYHGALDCIRKIIHQDGFWGLYRGMGGMVYLALPRFALIFYGNAMGKNIYKNYHGSEPGFDLKEVIFAGLFSQLFIVPSLVVPLERIKVLMQTNHPVKYSGQVHCLKYIVTHHGLSSLYRGLFLTYLRDMSSFGTYFLTYESLKHQFNISNEAPSLGSTILAGGLAGVAGWSVAIPADTAKNRHQATFGTGSSYQTMTTMFQKYGWRGFYRGSRPILIRAFPANAATFVGYELAMDVMSQNRLFST